MVQTNEAVGRKRLLKTEMKVYISDILQPENIEKIRKTTIC